MAWENMRLRPGFLVDLGARVELHLIGKEPVARLLGRRTADASDFGVAVEKHFFKIVGELQVFDGLRFALQRGVPAGFADGFALAHKVGDARVVAQKMSMHVHDELIGQRLGALTRHLRDRRLGPARVIERAVGFVHGDKSRGHAGGGLEKSAAGHALFARQLAAEFFDARLELALLFGLRRGHEFIARHRLGWYRRRVGGGFGGQQLIQLFSAKKSHKGLLRVGWVSGETDPR